MPTVTFLERPREAPIRAPSRTIFLAPLQRCSLCGMLNLARFPRIRGRKRFQWPRLFSVAYKEPWDEGGRCRRCHKAIDEMVQGIYEDIDENVIRQYIGGHAEKK